MPTFDQIPPEKPKKKKKGLIIAIAIIAVIGLLVGLFFALGLNKKLFMSDKDRFVEAETKSMDELAGNVANYYDMFLKTAGRSDQTYKLTFTPVLSDTLKSSLGLDQADLSFLNDLTFDVVMNSGDEVVEADIDIGVGDQHVMTVSAYFDFDNKKLLVTAPELTSSVLRFDISDIDTSQLDQLIGGSSLSGLGLDLDFNMVMDLLPSSDVVKNLITKYYEIILKNLGDVAKSTEDVMIEGITQKLNVYKVDVSEKTLKDVVSKVFEELKKDEEVKKIYDKAIVMFMGEDASFPYNSIMGMLESQINSSLSDSTTTILTLTDYQDNNNEIVGRKIEANVQDNKIELSYVTVTNGNQSATKLVVNAGEKGAVVGLLTRDGDQYNGDLTVNGDVIATANGTKQNDKVTGECVLMQQEKTLLTIGVENFDLNAAKEGKMSGKIRLAPGEELLKQIQNSNSSSVSLNKDSLAMLQNVSLEIDFDGGLETGAIKLNILNNDTSLLMVDAKYEPTAKKEVEIPYDHFILDVDPNNTSFVNDLVGTLNFDQVIANLRKTSMPKASVDALEKRVRQFKIRAQQNL